MPETYIAQFKKKCALWLSWTFGCFFTAYFIEDCEGHFIDNESYDTLWAINNFYKKDMGDQMQ